MKSFKKILNLLTTSLGIVIILLLLIFQGFLKNQIELSSNYGINVLYGVSPICRTVNAGI